MQLGYKFGLLFLPGGCYPDSINAGRVFPTGDRYTLLLSQKVVSVNRVIYFLDLSQNDILFLDYFYNYF